MSLQPWRSGEVIRIEDHTPTTKRFWIRVPELTRFDFLPGQFVTLDLPIHEKINKRLRSYSISSWPDGTNVFELLIVQARDGVGTAYLFNEVTVGTVLKFRGPQGVFTLPAAIDRDLVLVCTGTGIAPFRSMVHAIYLQKIPVRNVHLVFGCRHREDLLYYEEMNQLAQTYPSFHYHPVLSRGQWDGHRGYVHAVYESICREKPPALFYLCGWKNMVDEARQRITEMGYDKKDIRLELYG